MKLASLLKKYFSGDAGKVFRGMATLAAGAGLARVIGLAAMPLLTRIYSPGDFGVLSVFSGLILIIAPTLTLRYTLAVPLPRRDSTAINLMALAALLLIVNSALLFSLLLCFSGPLLSLLKMEQLFNWWYLIPLASAGLAAYELLTLWSTRKRAYKTIAKSQLAQNLTGTTVKLALGLFALKPAGLLLGQIITQSGGCLILWQNLKPSLKSSLRFTNKKRIIFLAKYFRGYPTYRLPSQFLLALSVQAPLLITAAFYDAGTTGQLGLAIMAITLPANLIGDNMAKAFYAEVSALGKSQRKRIRNITNTVIYRLAILGAFPALILFFLGEHLFSFVFGDEWALAGQLASALSIYLLFQFIQKPVAYLMYLYNGQKQLLLINIQRALLTALCFSVPPYFNEPPTTAVSVYSVCMALHYIFSIFVALKMTNKELA